ncbi:tripartite tricarboxylate transporter TctB family protein [Pelagibacterium montanilacus]|uniref:tripartite tricarboxylate transporter TctB family protein n=1 Tax=Pelagibacterium montanilacus TaxID=2185280 RepID=UPI000F8D71B7|nr:tripartite tricarboxylate transporter TctB family protein [Pelagibacterium montanilacus]
MDRRIDLLVALAFALLGLFVIFQATDITQGMMRDPIGPRMAFYAVGGMLAVGGAFLAFRHVVAWRQGAGHVMVSEGSPDEPESPASALQAFLLVGVCLAYAIAFQPLGYLFATPLFILAGLFVLGERKWQVMVTIAIVFSTASYLVFAQALSVRVPVGPLTGLFRDLGWIIL